LLDESSFSEEFQDLFGAGAAATGPKAGTSAAGQDQAIIVRHIHMHPLPSGAVLCRLSNVRPQRRRLSARNRAR